MHAASPYIETGFIGLQYAIQYSYFQHLHQKIHSNKTVNLVSTKIVITIMRHTYVDTLYDYIRMCDPQLCYSIFQKSPTILTIDDAPVVKLHMFYFPNFYNVDVRTLITFVVCFCLVIAYLFTSFFILRQLVQENQSGIKVKKTIIKNIEHQRQPEFYPIYILTTEILCMCTYVCRRY